MRYQDHRPESPLDPETAAALCGLVAQLCDDHLSDNDWHRLGEILDRHAAARRYYLRYIALHSALAVAAACPLGCSTVDAELAVERLTLERFVGRTSPITLCGPAASSPEPRRRLRSVERWIASLSAVLLIAATCLWWVPRGTTIDDNRALIASDGRGTISNEISETQRLVAEVSYVSDSATWQNPNSSFALASRVRSGQNLVLEHGQVELTYSSGAKLLLTGPSEFLVQPTGGKLRRGELVARVPEAGHGFTIETPHGKVIDLGTEFGVVVDDFGISQVSVFEGKVETLPTGMAGRAQDKIELTSGRAIQWTDKAITPIHLQGRRYQHPDKDIRADQINPARKNALDEYFRGTQLDAGRWRVLGRVVPSDGGLRLTHSAENTQRPYLITATEFDPSHGSVTVTCDLRFENVHDADHASIAILTRSSDDQSKPDTPWQDMLARSVCCRLMADPQSGEGILEAGTKYEADREFMNISWGGFSRPQPDILYRLEMRDDGLNVSFTVSLADNPTIHKTITCRSLFRGNQNFIALEGSIAATTVIERLLISQEPAPLGDTNPLIARAGNDSPELGYQSGDASKQLDLLAPKNSQLILADDFDDQKLNSESWKTLGDVVLKDGQAQLGLPNEEQHIDTWQARPYLLTKKQFDPADGTLTILGKATFAENFLHGYGGSFAVMTRADDAHGGGPAWENSILRRGVRCNFWPAAFGFDHSLEIHEKPSPNTISLISAEGFPISPNSRSYLFQIIDDGQSASLTFLDADNPNICRTISHPTSPAMRLRGYIGFESCWGSPVQLDDVRIYQADGK